MPSTVIRNFVYDPGRSALTVTFVSGRSYVYAGVPAFVAEAFRSAFAKGTFFNRRIRGRYPEMLVDPAGARPAGVRNARRNGGSHGRG